MGDRCTGCSEAPAMYCSACMVDLVGAVAEETRSVTEEEAIANMTAVVRRFLVLNKLPNPGDRQVKALTKRLYQMGAKGRKLS